MKPGVFTQLYVQLIFAVKYRDRLLNKNIKEEVFRYVSGIITQRRHKSIIINGMPDHIHILLGLNPDEKISDLVAAIKRSSSLFINEKKWFRQKFHWQDGYGAFTYSRSQLNVIYNYIVNQENHHRKKTFREEYISFLDKYEISYNKKYLFDFFE